VITTALNRPTSVIVDADGVIYVSNNGTSAGTGEVLWIVQWAPGRRVKVGGAVSWRLHGCPG